jgi:hypothetical protein
LWVSGVFDKSEPKTPLHPNAVARNIGGAILCHDSAGARSVFHEKEWDETLEDTAKHFQSGIAPKTPDLSPYGCTGLNSGPPLYVESTDVTGIANVTVELPYGTTIQGITRSDMVAK